MRYGSISYVVAILLLCKSSTSIHHAFVLPAIHTSSTGNNSIIQYNKQSISTIPVSVCYSSGGSGGQEDDIPNIINNNTQPLEEEKDTIRVRIWKALASSNGNEITLTQLCKLIGVRNKGDVRSHLIHVERQAKTIQNKSNEWRVRRGLLPLDIDADTGSQDGSAKGSKVGGAKGRKVGGAKKLKIKRRREAKNEEFIRLVS